MSDQIDVVFLGVNNAGMRIYEWLCGRDTVDVKALLTTKKQLSSIEKLQPDYLVACGYRHIVPESVLEIPSEGCVNVHPAYLPYNRGANPNVWSIVEGNPAGVTVHYMDADIDRGDIIAREQVETTFADTGKDLHQRLEEAQVDLVQDVWPDIEAGDISTTTQAEDSGTYHETNDFEDLCQLDPNENVQVKEFLDRIRALTFPPYDNAEIEIDGENYHVQVDIQKQ